MKSEMTEADGIWNTIKNVSINMYALPNQTVKDHVSRIKIHDHELHLKLSSTSVVVGLEEALGKKFLIEEVPGIVGLVVVKNRPEPMKIPPPEPKE